MSKDLLETIAYNNSLDYIETTTGANGYPRNIRGAIIGFETFEEAEKIAKEYGLRITTLFKRDGWNLYERNNNNTWEPLKITASDYGDDYTQYSVDDLDDFFANNVAPFLADFDDFDTAQSFLDEHRKIYDELLTIDDTQLVITCQGCYHETIDKELMSWSLESLWEMFSEDEMG